MINPLVTIIVPIYNTENYIEKCIESLIKQSYPKIEIILVDDGSTDGSDKICDKYGELDRRVQVIHKVNGGLTSSRKTGIENMTGEYGMIVDSDDWIDLNTIEECVKSIENTGAECVLFSYTREYKNASYQVHIFDDSKMYSDCKVKEIYRRVWGLYDTEMSHPEKCDSIVSCCMKLYSASVLRNAFFVDTKIVGGSEDALFNIYALRHCRSVYYLDKPYYHYRKQQNGTLSSTYRPNLIKQYDALFDLFDEAKEVLMIDEECKKAYVNRTALSIIGIGLNELNNPSFKDRISNIKLFIRKNRNRVAYKNMQSKYLPLLWKVFFVFAKLGMSIMVYLMLVAMNFLRSRV